MWSPHNFTLPTTSPLTLQHLRLLGVNLKQKSMGQYQSPSDGPWYSWLWGWETKWRSLRYARRSNSQGEQVHLIEASGCLCSPPSGHSHEVSEDRKPLSVKLGWDNKLFMWQEVSSIPPSHHTQSGFKHYRIQCKEKALKTFRIQNILIVISCGWCCKQRFTMLCGSMPDPQIRLFKRSNIQNKNNNNKNKIKIN